MTGPTGDEGLSEHDMNDIVGNDNDHEAEEETNIDK